MTVLGVVITAYNREDFIAKCVQSVLQDEGPTLSVRVVVMDNGSSDSTAEAAKNAGPDVRVISTPDNRHIVDTINRGFQAIYEDPEVDMVIVMNDDTQFTPGSIKRLVEACHEHPDSMMTPLQLNYWSPGSLDDGALTHVGQVRCLIEDGVTGRPLRQVYPLPTIIGAAMHAQRKVWENVGEFDPLFWFYGVDDDICTRARWLGYEVLLVPASHLLHAHNKLVEPPGKGNRAARLQKWRKELQARYLFQLKNPRQPLGRCVLSSAWHCLATVSTCLRWGWLPGAWNAVGVFLSCVSQYPRIAETRARHFDPERKIHHTTQGGSLMRR